MLSPMSNGTATRPRLKHFEFREDRILAGQPLRVDRAAGIIRSVKVLGLESANGRRYTPAAVKKAIKLYERASVRTNHPKKATDQRGVEEVFGWLESVKVGADGCLYGDLHILNPKSELAENVFLAAEKNPSLFGLSHNATGRGERRNGVLVIEEIVEVLSVDLVADPATTRGLFEGKSMPETAEKKVPENAEQGYDEKPDDEKEPNVFEQKATEILRSNEDSKTKFRRFKRLVRSQEMLNGDDHEDDEEEMEEEGDEEGGEEKSDAEESRRAKKLPASVQALQEENERYRRLEKGMELCESQGVVPNKVLRKALATATDEKEMLALIREHKASSRTLVRPRSSAPGQRLTESMADDKIPADRAQRARWLRGG